MMIFGRERFNVGYIVLGEDVVGGLDAETALRDILGVRMVFG